MATSLITKKRIAKSFKKLMTEQAFEKISVRQIMEDAGIRRQTYCQQLVAKLVREYHSRPFHSEMEYHFFIHYHSQALANAIKHLLDLSEQDYQQQAQLLTQLIKTAIEN